MGDGPSEREKCFMHVSIILMEERSCKKKSQKYLYVLSILYDYTLYLDMVSGKYIKEHLLMVLNVQLFGGCASRDSAAEMMEVHVVFICDIAWDDEYIV